MLLVADLLVDASVHHWSVYAKLFGVIVIGAGLWASAIIWGLWRSTEIRIKYLSAFIFALPAVILYLLPVLTVVNDVWEHRFHWRDRFLLVFLILLASQLLAALYGYGIKHPRYERVIGVQAGLEISLILLLTAMLYALALVGLHDTIGLW
jgi:hypothetical protein